MAYGAYSASSIALLRSVDRMQSRLAATPAIKVDLRRQTSPCLAGTVTAAHGPHLPFASATVLRIEKPQDRAHGWFLAAFLRFGKDCQSGFWGR